MCPSHLTAAQKLQLVNHAGSARLVWGTNCSQHLLTETLRSCYWATSGVPCMLDSNARWAAKIIIAFLEEPFLHVMRADYISSIKPSSCRAFLRPAQFRDAHAIRLMSVFKGSWYWCRFIQYSWPCHAYPCSEISSQLTSSCLRCFRPSDVSKWGQVGYWLCTALLQLGLGSSSWQRGPGARLHLVPVPCLWVMLCCCAWPADAVLARNYAISVIHTCIISWLCCSWEAADSRKFPRTWEKPNGTDECTETSSATRALGTQHPFPFFYIYEAKTMKLTSWILIFKTLYVLMSLKALGR